MKYAKLINNFPAYAPNPILIDGAYIGNPPSAVYEGQGYKPVQYTETPEAPTGFQAVEGWTETENEIIQTWTIEEVTEFNGDQAMQFLFGGME